MIAEEDPRKKYLLAASNGTNVTAPIRDVDLSYCSVKTGVNDLLDYMAISVSLIIPFVIGPLIVGVFQVIHFHKCLDNVFFIDRTSYHIRHKYIEL